MGNKSVSVSQEQSTPSSVSDSLEMLTELGKVVRRTREFLAASWLVPLLYSLVLFLTDPVKHALSSSVASAVTCSVDIVESACRTTNMSSVHTITSINFRLPVSANPLAWLGTHLWFWASALVITFVIMGIIWILRLRTSTRIRILQQAAISAVSGSCAAVLIDFVFGLPAAAYLMGLAFSICVWAALQSSVDLMAVGGTFLALAGPSTKLPVALQSIKGLQISLQTEVHTFWGIFLLVASMVIFLRTHLDTVAYLKRLWHDLLGVAGKALLKWRSKIQEAPASL